MSYDDCPTCKAKLEGNKLSCAECGWSKRKSKSEWKEDGGMRSWPSNCEYETAGLRCKFPAVFSQSTRGGGPYYCRFHAHPQGAMMDSLVCQQSQNYKPESIDQEEKNFDEMVKRDLIRRGIWQKSNESKQDWITRMRNFSRENAKKFAHSSPEKQWAHKILDRFADGETVHDHAFKCACEALKMDFNAVRSIRSKAA